MKKLSFVCLLFISALISTLTNTVYAAESPGNVQFNSGEHILIGNAITIYFPIQNGKYADTLGAKTDFRPWLNLNLQNSLTFGKIIATPDLFADPSAAISDGITFGDRRATFEKCLNVLLKAPAKTLDKVFYYMDYEDEMIESYVKQGLPASDAYKKLGKAYFLNYFYAVPEVAKLQFIGWDHFGKYAWSAYEAGHAEAVQTAIDAHNTAEISKQQQLLAYAYAKEGYADHFLTDRFASGHMRTPDKELAQIIHKDPGSQAVAAIIAILMHDEDNKFGLQVSNLRGDKWVAYGDQRYLDKENGDNLKLIQEVMQISSDEIKQAFLTGDQLLPSQYRAIQLMSNLDKLDDYIDYVNNYNGSIPLFAFDAATNDVLERPDINKLHPDPSQHPFSKEYMLPHGTKWNEWVTLLKLEINYHPEFFAGKSDDIASYVTQDGKLNRAGVQLLISSLGIFEKALFCADKTTDTDLRKLLNCDNFPAFTK